jgi:predicted transcriptional regulator
MSKVRSVIKLHTEGVSKLSIGELTGLPRNTVKKYIRLFLASGLSLEEVERMDEAALEKLVMDITRRGGLIEHPIYQTLISLFPYIDKKLKQRENSRKKLWKE